MADSAASPPRLGIDIGGTKIQFVLLRDGELVAERRVNTPKGLADITQVLVDGLTHFRSYFGPLHFIGICAPGSAHPDTNLWRNANILALNGHDLEAHFATALEQEVIIENDANCFALSCANSPDTAAHETLYALTVGTGLGGGLVHNGHLITGAGGLAAEAGHVPLSSCPRQLQIGLNVIAGSMDAQNSSYQAPACRNSICGKPISKKPPLKLWRPRQRTTMRPVPA